VRKKVTWLRKGIALQETPEKIEGAANLNLRLGGKKESRGGGIRVLQRN